MKVFQNTMTEEQIIAFNNHFENNTEVSQELKDKADAIMKECGCPCHDKGQSMLHIVACCKMYGNSFFGNYQNAPYVPEQSEKTGLFSSLLNIFKKK